MVHDSWISDGDVMENVGKFLTNVQDWNKVIFGNIFERKRRTMRELEKVQRALDIRFSV